MSATADLDRICDLADQAHAYAYWPGTGSVTESFIGSTRKAARHIAIPRPGHLQGVKLWRQAHEALRIVWDLAAKTAQREGMTLLPLQPAGHDPSPGDMTALAVRLKAVLAVVDDAKAEGKVRDARRWLEDVIGVNADQPSPERRCQEEDCVGEDGRPRLMGDREGRVCGSCTQRRHRARKQQRSAA